MIRAASLSLANALFQVVALKLLVQGPLLHARLAVSLMAGLAVFWLGLGAALATRLLGRPGLVGLGGGATVLLGGAGIPLSLKLADGSLADPAALFALCFVLLSLPLCCMGIALGIVYQQAIGRHEQTAGKLVAFSTLGFIAGFALANPLVSLAGISPALALCALAVALPARPGLGVGTVAVLFALVHALDLESGLDSFAVPGTVFWQNDLAAQHRHLLGGWSPYSRVDLYRTPSGCLAGLYNGAQQWAACPSPAQDFDVRRVLYPELKGDVLLIGAGGGQALVDMTRARSIVAVELDPFVVAAMKGPLASYNARAYLRHRVVTGDGRAYLDRTGRRFDAIVYEGTDFAVSRLTHSVISFESSLFTREGLARAASRLTREGLLVAMHTVAPAPTARFVRGLPAGFFSRVWQGVAISRATDFPFVMAVASRSRRTLERFSEKVAPLGYARRPQAEFAGWEAVTDDRPFLYYTSPRELKPLLISGALVLGFLACFLLLVRPRALTGYFSLIGPGFILLQLYLLAAFRSSLGGYSDTYAAVMGAMSLSSAAGSLLWERAGRKGALAITACGVAALLCCSHLVQLTGDLPLARYLLVCLGTAPVGFAMGLYLPAGLSRAGGKASVFLAVDAVGTALGFAVFYLAALRLGFLAALAIAVLLYGGALLLWPPGRMSRE